MADVWFDSGCMPFAQWGYPHQNEETFAAQYPADYICEAIDQTRGWFYTLMTVGTLVFDESAYRNVLCLGHILDKDGRKMSKHLGNVLEPMALMEDHGADAVRWFMLAAGSPWASRRVSHESIQEVVRKTLLTFWNTVSFHVLYARLAQWSPTTDAAPPVQDRPLIDRWLVSATQALTIEVDEALTGFDTQRAGRAIATFVDDLSNWYVRRSRRRFWDGDVSALTTLHDALVNLALVMAPMTPFITERVWQDLIVPTNAEAPAFNSPRGLASRPTRVDRRQTRRPNGPSATAGRTRACGQSRVWSQDPTAAVARTRGGRRLGSHASRTAGSTGRGTERSAHRIARGGNRRVGPGHCKGELPRSG